MCALLDMLPHSVDAVMERHSRNGPQAGLPMEDVYGPLHSPDSIKQEDKERRKGDEHTDLP